MKFLLKDHPRLRGEYVPLDIMIRHVPGSPPLARGIPVTMESWWMWTGITPACAGNTRRSSSCRRSYRDHPRLRGEYGIAIPLSCPAWGSPPLARGILVDTFSAKGWRGITPACAGNTISRPAAVRLSRDHPRLRGEYTKKIPYLQPFPNLHI